VSTRVERYAALIGEEMTHGASYGYALALGMISAIVTGSDTAAEQVDDIRDVLAALNRAMEQRAGGAR
jgi:hypothetical protein